MLDFQRLRQANLCFVGLHPLAIGTAIGTIALLSIHDWDNRIT